MSHKFFIQKPLSFLFIFLFSFVSFPQTLQVVSVSPTFNEIADNIAPNILVEFNVQIEPTSFDNISFSVFGERSGYHSGELKFLNENKTVSFVSDNNFNAGERVTVNLSRKLNSAEGDTLNGFSWTFRIPTMQKPLNFSKPVSYGGGGYGLQCIDMNNDGSPDIITSSGIIWINDGNGKFPSNWYLDDADGFYPIIVDDFNRDGFMDVLYTGTDGLILGLGNGAGNFVKSYYPWWFLDYTSVDINYDGYPDIAGINSVNINPPYDTSSYWAIALNDSTGQFNDTIWAGHLTGVFQKITTSDIDNDGDADIIIISSPAVTPGPTISGLDGLAIFRNNGGGVFGEYQLYPACYDYDFSISSPNYLYSSDFNNDGLIDIAVIGDFGGGVILNKGDGIFGVCSDTSYYRGFWYPEMLATFTGGDFNGDNWIDLAVSGFWSVPFESQSPKMYTILDNCNTYFKISCVGDTPFTDTIGTSEALILSNASADLNGNGYLDLIHSGYGVFITFNIDTITSVNDKYEQLSDFYLYQNYPNPFNSQTEIRFKVTKTEIVHISIFNIIGEEVRLLENNVFLRGKYRVLWDGKDNHGRDLPSGAYLIRANFAGSFKTVKALLLK